MAYWVATLGVRRDTTFRMGKSGIIDEEYSTMLGRLLRNDVLHEDKKAKTTVYVPGTTLESAKQLIKNEMKTYADDLNRALSMFLGTRRWSTIAPTVHYLIHLQRPNLSSVENVADRILETSRRRSRDRLMADVAGVIAVLDNAGPSGSPEIAGQPGPAGSVRELHQ